MMKTKQLFKSHLFSLAALFSMVLAVVSCTNEDIVQNGKTGENGKGFATFVAGEPKSRTSMDYNTGNFYWEEGDKIYVKDDDGTWQVSNAVDAAHAHSASFMFKVPGKFENSATYKVFYPGKNGSNNQVNIPATQTQTEPNTTKHFGESGDCGTADATGTIGGKIFSFQLEHQVAILVFQPYTNNDVLKGCYLTKIEVNSDDDITNTYILDPSTGALTGTGGGKQIILTTKDPVVGSINKNGFSLNTASANVGINGAYMFIRPGIHTLKVRYWVKDIITEVEGAITKNFNSFDYKVNTYYDMPANLNLNTRDYDGNNYYTWDAQQQYWYGYEWTRKLPGNTGQPTIEGGISGNFPTGGGGFRGPHHGGGVGRYDATYSCAGCPNINEMSWYCMKGDPRWDDNELWTNMGHLYKGGIWLLKKANIPGFRDDKGYDNANDYRQLPYSGIQNTTSLVPPSAANANKYFFLPALGQYYKGMLQEIGDKGYYWTASFTPWITPGSGYRLRFDRYHVYADYGDALNGYWVQAFE